MLAFSVNVNDAKVCTAGAPIDGVLTLLLAWTDLSRWCHGDCRFWVSRLDSPAREHVRWYTPDLALGDRVSAQIVDVDVDDPPSERILTGDTYAASLRRAYAQALRDLVSELKADPRAWAADVRRSVARRIREAREHHPTAAFRVTHNGHHVCTAGLRPPCVMSVSVGVNAFQSPGQAVRQRLSMHISGLDTRTQEHVHWDVPELRTSDTVGLELLSTDHGDAPSRRRRVP